jgi:hypothetical protein
MRMPYSNLIIVAILSVVLLNSVIFTAMSPSSLINNQIESLFVDAEGKNNFFPASINGASGREFPTSMTMRWTYETPYDYHTETVTIEFPKANQQFDDRVIGTGKGRGTVYYERVYTTYSDTTCTEKGSARYTTNNIQAVVVLRKGVLTLYLTHDYPYGPNPETFTTTVKGEGERPEDCNPGIRERRIYHHVISGIINILPPRKGILGGVDERTWEIVSVTTESKPPCLVDIYASAFLPPWTAKGRIPNPAPLNNVLIDKLGNPLPPDRAYYDYHEFGTDNRNSPQKGASARQWSYAVVDLCSDDKVAVKTRHGVGESHGYRFAYNRETGRLIEVEEKKTASDQDMTETITKTYDKIATVRFTAETAIPFIRAPRAPAIDYDFTIQLLKDEITDNIIYSIKGAHDGFPAYEIFIGTDNVYFHTAKVEQNQSPLSPFNKGQTLFSLYPPMEFSVSKNGQIPENNAYDEAFDTRITR